MFVVRGSENENIRKSGNTCGIVTRLISVVAYRCPFLITLPVYLSAKCFLFAIVLYMFENKLLLHKMNRECTLLYV
jgi:hypothetical protein